MLKQTKAGEWFERKRGTTIWYGKDRPARIDLARDENAVSPVIAVILMVAITVVLAAVVFVLVNNISGKNTTVPPQMSWNRDGSNLTLVTASGNMTWAEFVTTGCTSVPVGTVDAGDRFTGCTGRVTIRHTPSNSLVYDSD